MCGFSVFLSAQTAARGPGDADWRAEFCRAADLIEHRGPDESAVEMSDEAAFFFKRLAIIDVDDSRQPMRYPATGPDAGRWTIVFNGEIYNHRELRAELVAEFGATFATEGDTEVLAAGLHHWGPAAVRRLRGMFAFVAWDSETGALHAARDPFGIKPLYYMSTVDGLYLASEKKALAAFAPQRPVDPDALAHYLTLQYVPEPVTLHPQIRRLEPGRQLSCVRGGQPQVSRYFRPVLAATPVTPDTAFRRIRAALRDSVRAHLIADVPVGAFLSSGIDSTAVVALAREINPDITTFTAGFADTGYSEIDVAAETARQLGVPMVPTVVEPADVLRELPRIVWHLDDPVADPSLVPLYFLARTAARHVKVVLSGEGADELFGGYEIYREPAALAPVQGLPIPMQRGLRTLAQVIPEGTRGRSYLTRATTPIEERYYGNARIFTAAEKRLLLRGDGSPHTDVTAHLYREAQGLDDATTMQYVDLHTWLTGDILTKADRMSMAHSLELRVPFLDPAVYAAASSLPTALKLPPGSRVTKHALREAMRGLVPPSIVDRRKLGFPTPTRVWLRGEIGEWAGEIIGSSQADHLLDLRYAQRLLAEHRRGAADHSRKVWTVLVFCLWHAIAVEKSLDPALAASSVAPSAAVNSSASMIR